MSKTNAKAIKQHLKLKCEFSDEELLHLGDELANEMQNLENANLDFASVKKEWQGKIAALEATIDSLATKIRDKSEEREVECDVIRNFPRNNVKTITRLDNGVQFVEDMTDNDFTFFG